jgi:hypothetical protein
VEPTRRQRKARALSLLQGRDLEALRVWAGHEASALEFLLQLVSHGDALVRWRAVEGLGIAAEVRAAQGEEVVRERLRRLMWSMNHESGNLIWMAPDAAGEILARVPSLAAEFSRLVASFINLEPFVEGVHRAVARIAGVDPAPVAYLAPYLAFAITRPEAEVRAHGALALGLIDPGRQAEIREKLSGDAEAFDVYDRASGEIVRTTVEKLVLGA